MKIYLKELVLKNYKQYSNHTFNFMNKDGNPYKFICFFGPNGIGKSTALEAISTLTMNTFGRDNKTIVEYLRKYVSDFDDIYDQYKNKNSKKSMLLKGTYVMDGKEYVVEINENGFVRNDLLPILDEENAVIKPSPFGDNYLKYYQRISHFLKTDSDLSFYKFQLVSAQEEVFETILTELTGFKTECAKISGLNAEDNYYRTDCIFVKPKHKCHFKQMSAGEKKVVKAFSEVLNLIHSLEKVKDNETPLIGFPSLLLYDNIEFHVYYKRHISFINCLKRIFSSQQIFATTHSNILIERYENNQHDENEEMMINVEKI